MTDLFGDHPDAENSPQPPRRMTRRELREAEAAAAAAAAGHREAAPLEHVGGPGEPHPIEPHPMEPHPMEPHPVDVLAHEDPLPARPARRRRGGSVISFVVMVAILAGLGVLGFVALRPLFAPEETPSQVATDYPGPGGEEILVEIPEGATGGQIGLILKDAGVVLTADAFTAAYTANTAATSIQPGSYTLNTQMRAADAVTALLDPNRRADQRITIPEGYTAAEIYQRVGDIMGVPVEDVRAVAHDYAALGLDGPPNSDPNALDPMEGWLYPSTYSIAPGATPADVLRQMYDRTISELDALGVAPEDRLRVLTLGSIAIKEANTEEDWAKVVRAIENRLAEGNSFGDRIQVDSSYEYYWATAHPRETLDENLHNTDTTNPFNTRHVPGLPPSPIASVDVRVLRSVVNPAEGDWTYWITVDLCTGETRFTSSIDEFNVWRAEFKEWYSAWLAADRVCAVGEGAADTTGEEG